MGIMGSPLLWHVVLILSGADVFLGCSLKNFTMIVERQECDYCMAINTTICSGLCYTKDTNIRIVIGRQFLIQRACMYQSVAYRAAEMPGCPLYVYPVALRCRCMKCNTVQNECVHRSKRLLTQCPKKLLAV